MENFEHLLIHQDNVAGEIVSDVVAVEAAHDDDGDDVRRGITRTMRIVSRVFIMSRRW